MKKITAILAAVMMFLTNTAFALTGVTSITLTQYNEKSCNNNIFKVSGNSQSFTLLGKEDGKYFVAANEDYGTRAFSKNDSEIFNPSENGNIANWLNNEFISAEYDGKKLPQEILDYVDYSHSWQTEPSYTGNEGNVTCGIALLSQTEFLNHLNILGIKDNMNVDGKNEDDNNFWWTRSPDCKRSGKCMSIGFLGNIWSETPSNSRLIRPVFYINKEFFENVYLDTAYMGVEIKKILRTVDFSKVGYSSVDKEIISDDTNDFVSIDVDRQWSKSQYDKNYVIGKKISFLLDINNMSSRKRTAYAYWQIGNNYSEKKTLEVEANSKNNLKLVLPINIDGRYDINVFVSIDGIKYTKYSYDINYIVPNNARSTSKGYNVSYLSGEAGKERLDLLKASGVYQVRASGFWNEIETSKGVYKWATLDSHMKNAAENEIDDLYVLGLYNTGLYKTLDENGKLVMMGSEEERQAFVNYAVEVAKRYPQIKRYEIWNEPNANNFWPEAPNIENYKKLVRAVSTELKKINPEIEIVIGVTSNSSVNTPTDTGNYWCINWKEFISSLMDDDFQKYFDAVSIHTYYTNKTRADQKSDIADVVDVVRKGGGFKNIYITETGGYSGPAWYNKTEEQKGQEMVRQFVIGDENQIDGTWLYELVNGGTDQLNSEHNYGVITFEKSDFRPLDGYYAVKDYLSRVDNAVYLGKVALNENITGNIYAADDSAFMIAWSNSDEVFDYSFENKVSQYDMYGKHVKDSNKISFDAKPSYIYGLNEEYIKSIATDFIAESIMSLSSTYNNGKFVNVATRMKQARTADEVYEIITLIESLASEEINVGNLTHGEAQSFLYDISRIYNRLANYLTIMDNAVVADKDFVEKAYEAYEATLATLSSEEDKAASSIWSSGLNELKQLTYDSDVVYNKPIINEDYSLDKKGELSIKGHGIPGEIINLKITDEKGKILYIDTQTADAYGECEYDYTINGGFGMYTIYVNGKSVSKDFIVNYNNYDGYNSFLRKKYYGMVIKNEQLLNLSRDYLFRYSELSDNKKLLVDVAWTLSSGEANAKFTIKNIGEEVQGKVILAGYDNNNKLIAVNSFDISILNINRGEYNFELNFENKPVAFKAFLWDNTSQMVPLSCVRKY